VVPYPDVAPFADNRFDCNDYAMGDDGNLSSGPFSSLEECIKRITQPKNGATASKRVQGIQQGHLMAGVPKYRTHKRTAFRNDDQFSKSAGLWTKPLGGHR
jgi:hypothetical protein